MGEYNYSRVEFGGGQKYYKMSVKKKINNKKLMNK